MLIPDALEKQRTFFRSGQTQSIDFRLEQLKRLKQAILEAQTSIVDALRADLHKPVFEAYLTEIGILDELNYAIKNLRAWTKPRKVATPVTVLPATAQICPQPLGVVLIIAPWNYPFQLCIAPLIGAIAAGNCAILKPSELTPHTSQVIANLIRQHFDPAFITVIEGGVETSQQLLAERFDHIFFTGGTAIGKRVMAAAAEHLTPVTLELGGKSPCLVDADVPIDVAARRITWGKFTNAGQTCIAPDYLLVHRSIKPQLLQAIAQNIQAFYGDNPASSPDYGRIVNQKHFERLAPLLESGQVVVGGDSNPTEHYIAPTVLDGISWQDPVMQEEIFGPILPVLEYEDLNEAIAQINQRPKPLALYFFSQNQQRQAQVLQATSSGGVCINDTILQVGVPNLPFGGVGPSGMGRYHGKASFDTFSHERSILKKPFFLDLKLRYAPYKDKLRWIKQIIR
ncbi:aldehyde dehydrogenase [Trichocoleus sp. FACHB-591]|uniref:aldehyde dehydrogenase n=1 Tax=Trichocoleus sp. FACHB-591 TaxID=2692872 RepID=UPI001684B6B6|nr:aldehyde dehydrogenase [Trichocoleus sp. FACHB-591]MBD2095983.1 aldehyde dehydrogenase [Trichocoleus sp. FACHB-591]